MASDKEAANALKLQGNKAFANHDWPTAVDFYSQAIEKYDQEPSFFCNRAQVRPTSPQIYTGFLPTLTLSSLLADPNQTRGFWIRCRRRHQGVGIGLKLRQG
jgi:serine/threonine-protein phosphatase 5